MAKYMAASKLFSNMATEGESGALALYCQLMADPDLSKASRDNILERIADELNHLLGGTLDAIREADLRISPDGLDEILDGLRAAKRNL